MAQDIKTKCPICKKSTNPDFRPFCSKRCKEVDLHHWIQGVYKVESEETEEEDQDKSR